MYWEVPYVHDGTIFILGGGPSLRDCDLSLLHEQTVIGTNNAYELGDWVKYNFFMDVSWWRNNGANTASYTGTLITDNPDTKTITDPRIKRLFRNNVYGIDTTSPSQIAWNRNSGGGAVNIAVHMGATRIVLLGFDMKPVSGAPNSGHNWHDKHKTVPAENQYKKFLRFFDAIKEDCLKLNAAGHKLEIINCTPDSALTIFPMMRLEDVL